MKRFTKTTLRRGAIFIVEVSSRRLPASFPRRYLSPSQWSRLFLRLFRPWLLLSQVRIHSSPPVYLLTIDSEVVAVVVNTVAAVLPSFNLTPINTDWSFTLPPSGFLPNEESVFGEGFKMFSYKKSGTYTVKGHEVDKEAGVTAYCIGCQISGKLHILGTLRYTFPTFITAATLQISGPMNLYAEVGLLLYTKLEKGFEKNILTIPISGLAISIPDIIHFGPEIILTMSASLKFETDGFLGMSDVPTTKDHHSYSTRRGAERNLVSGVFDNIKFPQSSRIYLSQSCSEHRSCLSYWSIYFNHR
jgi:hypothetical protein